MTRLALLVPLLFAAACGGASFDGSFVGTFQGQPVTATFKEDGEKLSGGRIKAAKMTSEECHKKYG